MAVGGVLSCTNPVLILQGSSPTAGVTFTWIGPGFPNPMPNPMVTLPGTYTLIVTAQNGCTSTATAVVTAAQIPLITAVQVTNDLNGQGVGAISITIVGATNYSVVWTSNGQVVGGQNLVNLMAGVYVAVVTSVDGCTATVSTEICKSNAQGPTAQHPLAGTGQSK